MPSAARRTTWPGLPLGRSPETSHQTARPSRTRKPSGTSAPPNMTPKLPKMSPAMISATAMPIASARSRGVFGRSVAASSSSGTRMRAAAYTIRPVPPSSASATKPIRTSVGSMPK